MRSLPWAQALEEYSQKRPHEVLRVEVVQGDGDADLVLIFRGYSSSLMRSTPADPDQPVIAPDAMFVRMDRLQGPFDPTDPQMIASELDPEVTRALLQEVGLDPLGLGRSNSDTGAG